MFCHALQNEGSLFPEVSSTWDNNMAACSVFEEDEVFVITEKGYKCGLVLESSEYVSSDEEDDPNFAYERVRKGTVRVAWHPTGDETVITENQVKSVKSVPTVKIGIITFQC